MHPSESIGTIVYTGRKDGTKIIAVNKKTSPYNALDDIRWRLPTETPKEGEDDYHTLERGLMEELGLEVSAIHRDPVHVFEYPLPDNIREDLDFYRVKVYAARTTEAAVDRIRVNHRELEGYLYFPIKYYGRLYWKNEKEAVRRFCRLKNIDLTRE